MAEFQNENQAENSFGEVLEREPAEGTPVSTVTPPVKADDTKVEAKTEETETTEEAKAETEGTEETAGEGDEPKLTEKGTKLDPNPQSAVHQQLANEKRARADMEKVLGNPDLLAKFMETQYGKKVAAEAVAETPSTKQYTAEDFQNLDDVAKVITGLQSEFSTKMQTLEAENKELKNQVGGLVQGGRAQQQVTTFARETQELQSQPELNSKSPDFIKGLEEDIADMYHKLDFDEGTQTYRGNYSVADIGSRMISAAQKARQKGSEAAQTIVKDKSAGKIVENSKAKETPSDTNLTPGDSIAAGIAKTFGR